MEEKPKSFDVYPSFIWCLTPKHQIIDPQTSKEFTQTSNDFTPKAKYSLVTVKFIKNWISLFTRNKTVKWIEIKVLSLKSAGNWKDKITLRFNFIESNSTELESKDRKIESNYIFVESKKKCV